MTDSDDQPEAKIPSKALAAIVIRVFAYYLVISFATRLIEDLLETSGLKVTNGSSDPSIWAVVSVAVLSLAWSLTSQALTLTLLARTLARNDGFPFRRTIELLVIENLRALAATLFRLPFLVVPAVIEWIRLTPVSYIVILKPQYRLGRIDALDTARTYFKKHRLRVTGLFSLSLILFFIEFITTGSSENPPLWKVANPKEALVNFSSIAIFAALHLGLDAFSFKCFQKSFADN